MLNYKRHKIINESGIRSIILRRNRFSDGFATLIQKIL